MRPPICAVCRKRFNPSDGGTVAFSNYEALPDGVTGHPDGLEWFCGKHIEAAKENSHRSSSAAIAIVGSTSLFRKLWNAVRGKSNSGTN